MQQMFPWIMTLQISILPNPYITIVFTLMCFEVSKVPNKLANEIRFTKLIKNWPIIHESLSLKNYKHTTSNGYYVLDIPQTTILVGLCVTQ